GRRRRRGRSRAAPPLLGNRPVPSRPPAWWIPPADGTSLATSCPEPKQFFPRVPSGSLLQVPVHVLLQRREMAPAQHGRARERRRGRNRCGGEHGVEAAASTVGIDDPPRDRRAQGEA